MIKRRCFFKVLLNFPCCNRRLGQGVFSRLLSFALRKCACRQYRCPTRERCGLTAGSAGVPRVMHTA
ncbi:hypothetical protein CV_1123 [Chromobacterium violaceum ATCC 12472]|uniref:Uncharacterized protein n=1 Tax=Chromobacterium violaceum (strain ATCC 12472 / DSM 30191 / JCM 1249 / CCUG 213 / NBRC 12614 / NCIMB 9131 / NCTC 9757 / MK) TaxID=243365 RepID=Q7NYZ9_CHRVO|nr:hypothetical protein CV_1123 [Chromobacterium violaceum ATCC 12472]